MFKRLIVMCFTISMAACGDLISVDDGANSLRGGRIDAGAPPSGNDAGTATVGNDAGTPPGQGCVDAGVAPPSPTPQECVMDGCEGMVCRDAQAQPEDTTACGLRPMIYCLADEGLCERQSDGQCGWTRERRYDDCRNVRGPSGP